MEENSLTFWQGSWKRVIKIEDPHVAEFGLVELIDNNPLVCTDAFSVPGPLTTLLMLAAGPLIDAGLLLEAPVVITNAPIEDCRSNEFLASYGWHEGAIIDAEAVEGLDVYALNMFAKIRTPERDSDIDDLYAEKFARSFYISRDETSEWDSRLVKGRPHALFRLRITPGEEESLLTVQSMADVNGKCGAAQMVHAMNVMCGFEECFGIPIGSE